MNNSIKYNVVMVIAVTISSLSLATEYGQKYQRGDCITPTKESYSWHGEYATVEAFTPIEGFTSNKVYVLAFPFWGANSALFSPEIERATRKVKPSSCGN